MRKKDLSQVPSLAASGMTLDEICAAVGACEATVTAFAKRNGIGLAPRVTQTRTIMAARQERMRELAAEGSTVAEAATLLGLKDFTIRSTARSAGIVFNRSAPAKRDLARIEKMVGMYRQGLTLEKIGQHHKLTRERVRQILKSQGLTASEGGASKVAAAKTAKKIRDAESRAQLQFGQPYAIVAELRRAGTLRAYKQQKCNAGHRGVEWRLDFASWFAVWQASGKLLQRGRGIGKYVMSRILDDGPYALGNVHIQLSTENNREGIAKCRGHKAKHAGVYMLYPGTTKPWLAVASKKTIGFFASEDEAVAARTKYLDSTPLKSVRGRGYSIIKGVTPDRDRFQVMAGKKYIGTYRSPAEALAARAAYVASLEVAELAPSPVPGPALASPATTTIEA